MRNEQSILEVLDAATARRAERRNFLRVAGSVAALSGGLALAACNPDDNDGRDVNVFTPTPTATVNSIDVDVLNFALNLEYLEAQFYSYAVFGTGLTASMQTGVTTVGAQGTVSTSGTAPPRAVNFSGETLIGQYAREIAADEIAHVNFLRSALGSAAVAQPDINISGDAAGAFTAAARAAGVVSSTGTFDPYASPDNFLLAAFIFEDVGVTAYKGASPVLQNKTYLEAAAGILAAEAYHAGLIRTVLYNRGQTNASLITNAGKISDARDSLDGTTDLDQPITTGAASANYAGNANLVPSDANGIAFSRTTSQVLHIAYLSATAGATKGGFFPNGTNGNIRVAA